MISVEFDLFAVILVLATVFRAYGDEVAQQEGCFDEETNHFWPAGESYDPIGRCLSINCISNDGVFDALACATYVQPEGECEVIEEDLSKPYPECCATMRCKPKDPPQVPTASESPSPAE